MSNLNRHFYQILNTFDQGVSKRTIVKVYIPYSYMFPVTIMSLDRQIDRMTNKQHVQTHVMKYLYKYQGLKRATTHQYRINSIESLNYA